MQVLVAAALVWPRRGSLTRAEALDRFFLTQAPWGVWLLVVAAWSMALPPIRRPENVAVAITAIVAALATARRVTRFFRDVSRVSPRSAARIAFAHQTISYLLILPAIGAGVQLLPRILGWWPWGVG